MRSPRKLYTEKIRGFCLEDRRFVDLGARVRIYRRGPDGKPEPVRWYPKLFGGRFDRFEQRYVGPPGQWIELKLHEGQAPLLDYIFDSSISRVMALGAPGGGKTECIVAIAVLFGLMYPNSFGGVTAPTHQRLKVVWNKLLKTIVPAGWLHGKPRKQEQEIELVNGRIYQFRSAKRQSDNTGSPIAGNDWNDATEDEQQNQDDDTLNEVDARGRNNAAYKVFSSATNEVILGFQSRLKEYELSPDRAIVRFTGPQNCFTPVEHWDRLKRLWSPEEYERRVLSGDPPIVGLAYGAFSNENLRTVPQAIINGVEQDITRATLAEKYGDFYEYLVGTDFGVRTTASSIIKVFRPPMGWPARERLWGLIDEVITEGKTTDWHASALLERFDGDPSRFIAVTGQDSNSTDPDRSDFVLFKKRGINIVRASYSKRIYVRHRIAMMNALCHAADGRRRLFVACDSLGRVIPKKTYESFTQLRIGANDKPESYGKGTKGGEDLTHYTDAPGYAIYPFEHFRGAIAPEAGQDSGTRDTGFRPSQRHSRISNQSGREISMR